MNFLVDQNRSPRLAELLRNSEHNAVHTQDLGLERAEDAEQQAQLLAEHLDDIALDLGEGAIVVVSDQRIRIRRLPLLHEF